MITDYADKEHMVKLVHPLPAKATNFMSLVEEIYIPEDISIDYLINSYGSSQAVFTALRKITLAIGAQATYPYRISTSLCGSLPALEDIVVMSPTASLGHYVFGNNPSLLHVVLPASLTYVAYNVFTKSPNVEYVIMQGSTPPTLESVDSLGAVDMNRLFYVPDDSVETYKSARNWSAHADKIRPVSELTGGCNCLINNMLPCAERRAA